MYTFTLTDKNHVELSTITVPDHNLGDLMQELFYMLEDFMNGNDVIDAIEADFKENAPLLGKWFYHLPIGGGFNLFGHVPL